MTSPFTAMGLVALIIAYVLFKRFTRPSLSMIRGPKSPSFILGNLLELHQGPTGETDSAWQSQYGNVVRFKGILGGNQLLITDPTALQKILNTYSYLRPTAVRVTSYAFNGGGLVWADPEAAHKRQKGIILPGLGLNECKSFLPIFRDCAESICMRWSETITNNNGQGVVINVLEWLSRGTLDALGRAAFDVKFGCIQDDLHPLVKTYKNCLNDIFGLPSGTQIFIQAALEYIPIWILLWMTENVSSHRLTRMRDAKATVTSVAKELLQETDALLQGKGNRDIFSLLVKANMDATAKKKLSNEELYSNMCTLLLAGHETTANTVAWMLLEFARSPNVQSRLRDEIRKMEATIYARGDSILTATDLESMSYLNAVIKEALRLHPISTHVMRVAGEDDILPLSKPIRTESGDMINEVCVPKGTKIVISLAAYNRAKDLWGEDAHEFKPDRWLDGTTDDRELPSVGVYSNILSFSGGVRACIGWRFALVELQAFLWTLVGKFEFAMTDKAERITRREALAVVPLVDGEFDRGVQMPLAVSVAPQDDI